VRVPMTTLHWLAWLAGSALATAGKESGHLDGAYVIVNRASGRRIISGPTGFSASMGGPERPIYFEHRWQFVPQANDTYTIVNLANGMRIFAQSGKDHTDGFLTTDQGPIYQDQTWRPLPQNDGSHVLANAKSGRIISASVGLEGADGFAALQALSESFSEDQAWWLIDPDGGETETALKQCQAQLVEEQLKSHQLAQETSTCRAAAEHEIRLASQLSDAAAKEVLQVDLDALRGETQMAWAVAVILIFALAWSYFWTRGSKVVEDENKLCANIRHEVFPSESEEGLPVRIVQILCPGVEHSGIQVDLISDGCDVMIQRKASLGLDAMQWKRRFRFEAEEGQGSFEFREDRMELDHGLLKLVFQANSYRRRTVRFPQHYSLAASDGDLLWESASTSAGSFEACSSPARSLAKDNVSEPFAFSPEREPSRGGA